MCKPKELKVWEQLYLSPLLDQHLHEDWSSIQGSLCQGDGHDLPKATPAFVLLEPTVAPTEYPCEAFHCGTYLQVFDRKCVGVSQLFTRKLSTFLSNASLI